MRRIPTFLLLAALVLGLAASSPARAFGKNKITYDTFDWQVYRSPHFDVHYYPQEELLLEDIVSEAESAYLEISRMLDHELSFRIPLIIYKTHGDFEQTNISLQEIPEAVGAFAEPFQNRMVLPIDDPPDRRYKLIKHELTHIFQFDIFYAGSLRRTIRAQPPLWFMEGMASYVADDEDSFDQMIIRDAVVNNIVPSVRQLNFLSFLTYRFGHAAFDFIEERFGKEGLRNFIFEYRKALLTNNVEKAVRDAFGWEIDEFDRNFQRFLRKKYLPTLLEKRSPDDYGKEIGLKKPGRITLSPALSPSGELVAALSAPGQELDVVVLSAEGGKIIRNLTKGFTNSYENVVTEAFSGDGQRDVTWSPASDQVGFFVRKGNKRLLLVYDVLKGRRVATLDPQVDQAAAPAFSPDGSSVLYAGNRGGLWDIYRMDLSSREVTNVTRDEYYDASPSWSADGKRILYTRRIGEHDKVFMVEADDPSRKVQLTFGASSDIEPVLSRDGSQIFFSSDRRGGIYNLHVLDLDTARVRRLTDVVGGAFAPLEMAPQVDGTRRLAFTAFYGGTFRLYRMDLGPTGKEGRVPLGEEEGAAGAVPDEAAELAGEEGEEEVGSPGSGGEGEEEVVSPGSGEEAEPFRPPLRLTLDEGEKRPYKLVWSVDSPGITAGVADDGTIFTDVQVIFSDLLGDHRFYIGTQSVSTYSNVNLQYLNFKRRYTWGGQLIDYRDYYLVGDQLGDVAREQGTRVTGGLGLFQYPFSRYYRINLSGGAFSRSFNIPFLDQGGFLQFEKISDTVGEVGVSFSGDTVRFRSFGPYHGKRFSLGYTRDEFFSGDSEGGLDRYTMDFRAYGRMTRRSLLALRVAGIVQSGENPSVVSLGGLNQLRGFEFREFFGDNIAFANIELRFPLVDSLRLPFGLDLGPVRGLWFADVGTAWFDDTNYCVPLLDEDTGDVLDFCDSIERGKAFYNPDTGFFEKYEFRDSGTDRLIHGKASSGLGFNFFFGPLQMNWVFSKIWDGDDFGPWHTDFYINYDF